MMLASIKQLQKKVSSAFTATSDININANHENTMCLCMYACARLYNGYQSP